MHIETGRFLNVLDSSTGMFRKTRPEERLCRICNSDCIEDEMHFLLVCSSYTDERQNLFDQCNVKDPNFCTFTDDEKLAFLMSDGWKLLSTFIFEIWQKRRSIEYVGHLYN